MKTVRTENYRLGVTTEAPLSYGAGQTVQIRVVPPAFALRRYDPLMKKKQLSNSPYAETERDLM